MITIGKVKVFTVREIAEKFRITELSVRTYIREGRLPGQKVGRAWYVSEEGLQDFFRTAYFKPKKAKK